jgi:hypothetical protein
LYASAILADFLYATLHAKTGQQIHTQYSTPHQCPLSSYDDTRLPILQKKYVSFRKLEIEIGSFV